MIIAPMKVELLDHMGSDLTVVNAARVSFSKESDFEIIETGLDATQEAEGAGPTHVKQLRKGDAKLINYLAEHNHWTPFGHAALQFRIKAPIFVARQLVKHQVGLVWNEESRRYIDSEPEFWFPEAWSPRPEGSIKQGAGEGSIDLSGEAYFNVLGKQSWMGPKHLCEVALATYNGMLAAGVAPEEARMILPLNTMTNWWWTGSLAAWVRVCKLRLDPHAQKATREIAQQINALAEPLFPVAWKALLEN
jgi:thymidylate synthase (FAD)